MQMEIRVSIRPNRKVAARAPKKAGQLAPRKRDRRCAGRRSPARRPGPPSKRRRSPWPGRLRGWRCPSTQTEALTNRQSPMPQLQRGLLERKALKGRGQPYSLRMGHSACTVGLQGLLLKPVQTVEPGLFCGILVQGDQGKSGPERSQGRRTSQAANPSFCWLPGGQRLISSPGNGPGRNAAEVQQGLQPTQSAGLMDRQPLHDSEPKSNTPQRCRPDRRGETGATSLRCGAGRCGYGSQVNR